MMSFLTKGQENRDLMSQISQLKGQDWKRPGDQVRCASWGASSSAFGAKVLLAIPYELTRGGLRPAGARSMGRGLRWVEVRLLVRLPKQVKERCLETGFA